MVVSTLVTWLLASMVPSTLYLPSAVNETTFAPSDCVTWRAGRRAPSEAGGVSQRVELPLFGAAS